MLKLLQVLVLFIAISCGGGGDGFGTSEGANSSFNNNSQEENNQSNGGSTPSPSGATIPLTSSGIVTTSNHFFGDTMQVDLSTNGIVSFSNLSKSQLFNIYLNNNDDNFSVTSCDSLPDWIMIDPTYNSGFLISPDFSLNSNYSFDCTSSDGTFSLGLSFTPANIAIEQMNSTSELSLAGGIKAYDVDVSGNTNHWTVYRALGGNGDFYWQIYAYSETNNRIILVSTADGETLADGNCYNPRISANGRYVVFDTYAENLHGDSSLFARHVVYKDLNNLDAAPIVVDTVDGAVVGNSSAQDADINEDGRWIVFKSASSNLDGPVASWGIFIKDMNNLTNAPIRLSELSDGTMANDSCDDPMISHNGNMVLFTCNATNMPGGVGGGVSQAYIHRIDQHGISDPVLVSATAADAASDRMISNAVLDKSGTYVFLQSRATNFPSGDGMNAYIWRKNIATKAIELVSKLADNTPVSTIDSFAISGGQRFDVDDGGNKVIFLSTDVNLSDYNGYNQAYLKEISTNAEPVHVSSNGTDIADASVIDVAIFQGPGTIFAFSTEAKNLSTVFNETVYVSDFNDPSLITSAVVTSSSSYQREVVATQMQFSTSPSSNKQYQGYYNGNAVAFLGLNNQLYLRTSPAYAGAIVETKRVDLNANGDNWRTGVGNFYLTDNYIYFTTDNSTYISFPGAGTHLYRKSLQNPLAEPTLVSDNGVDRCSSIGAFSVDAEDNRIVFECHDNGFLGGLNGGNTQIYVSQLNAGGVATTFALVSGTDATTPADAADAAARNPQINNDNDRIIFQSTASNLPGGGSGTSHIYYKETMALGVAPTLLSKLGDGTPGDDDSEHAVISGDGRYVAFASRATNFEGHTGGVRQIYTVDLDDLSQDPVQISKSTAGVGSNWDNSEPSINNDGSLISFTSGANNLDLDVSINSTPQVYLRNVTASETAIVSRPIIDGLTDWGTGRTSIVHKERFEVMFVGSGNYFAPGAEYGLFKRQFHYDGTPKMTMP